ncbi:MAG: septum formation initiator family protein [Bacteroidetes bacterium]|nr:MAG: septum formation initiator family protein [Bacteroidota bacterium]
MIVRFLYKYRYLVVVGTFVVWMSFFDKNNWWDVWRLQRTYNEAIEERDYYREQADIARSEYNALFTHPDSLEKFAREKYLMKKDNEDVFVIIKEDK